MATGVAVEDTRLSGSTPGRHPTFRRGQSGQDANGVAERAVILRAGVIVGPREYVGRLPWWLRRVERGGRVLAPGSPSRRIQPVDVRDVAAFALYCVAGLVGTFNVTASGHETMGDFLTARRSITGSDAVFEWITDELWLVAHGVAQWTELPLWRTYAGVWAVDSSRARAAGLGTRAIAATVRDTWVWMRSGEASVAHERSAEQGISPERETAILGMWDARQAGRCGGQ